MTSAALDLFLEKYVLDLDASACSADFMLITRRFTPGRCLRFFNLTLAFFPPRVVHVLHTGDGRGHRFFFPIACSANACIKTKNCFP